MVTVMDETQTLSDVELLALVLGNKTEAKKLSGIPIAELFGFHGHYDAEQCHGVSEPAMEYGQPATRKLLAIRELWVRCMASKLPEYTICDDSNKIGAFLCAKMAGKKHEVMSCLFLDNGHKIIRFEEMTHGTIDASSVYARTIAQRALELNAAAIVMVHNHPSAGSITPSAADIHITKHVRDGLKILDIRLLDNFLICGNQFTSFAAKGLM